MGGFANALSDAVRIPYEEIPGFPISTAIGHAGKLLLGELDGLPLVVMAGRFHLYEGYTAQQVACGVRLFRELGVKQMVLTNAAGGINLDYAEGALVLISDHINLQGANPLIGLNDDGEGPRFPDMTEAYSQRMRKVAQTTATELGIPLHEGVYAAMLGPSYETPAEIRFLKAIGADLVGMSTVGEAIVARHAGIEVLGISRVTNIAAGLCPGPLNHSEVLETGRKVSRTFLQLLRAILPKL